MAGFSLTFEVDQTGQAVRLVPAAIAISAGKKNAPPASPAARATSRPSKGADKTYSLKVEKKSAGAVVAEVAGSLGRKPIYEPQVGERLKQLVTLDLKNVTLDYLLNAVLDPLGLSYRLSDQALEIVERP